MNHRSHPRFRHFLRPALGAGVIALVLAAAAPALGQNPPATPVPAPTAAPAPPPATPAPQVPRPTPPPQFVSPEVAADGHITFRIYAPNAKAIRLSAGDIPGMMGPAAPVFTKADNGVWEVTIGPIDPGAYRYTFNVDGVATVDPRNAVISESNTNVSSLVLVPGSDVFDTKDVPHGAVAVVTYKSTALGLFRRMHVYTPPGLRERRGEVSRVLPAARRRRQRQRVVDGRPRRLHSGQPDRGEEGTADDRRDAGGPSAAHGRRARSAGRRPTPS